jgi:signal transduction histidine kinase
VESPDLRAQIAPVKLSDLVSQIRTTMGTAARHKGVELDFAFVDHDPQAEFNSDQRLLHLVLRNLVENSIKFTPGGGTVTLRFSRRDSEEQPEMVLEVIDTGIGIPPEHQQRVFERFYQVDPARSGSAGRGTGLGLAIVKHAIHALGGQVELKSTPGQGTTVSCILPHVEIAGAFQAGSEEAGA